MTEQLTNTHFDTTPEIQPRDVIVGVEGGVYHHSYKGNNNNQDGGREDAKKNDLFLQWDLSLSKNDNPDTEDFMLFSQSDRSVLLNVRAYS